MKMRKNKGETYQGRPNNRPLVRDKKRFLLVFRSIRFRVMGSSLILKISLQMATTENIQATNHAERCVFDGLLTGDLWQTNSCQKPARKECDAISIPLKLGWQRWSVWYRQSIDKNSLSWQMSIGSKGLRGQDQTGTTTDGAANNGVIKSTLDSWQIFYLFFHQIISSSFLLAKWYTCI